MLRGELGGMTLGARGWGEEAETHIVADSHLPKHRPPLNLPPLSGGLAKRVFLLLRALETPKCPQSARKSISTAHHHQAPAAADGTTPPSAPSPVLRPGISLQVWPEQHSPGACAVGMGWGHPVFTRGWGELCLQVIQPLCAHGCKWAQPPPPPLPPKSSPGAWCGPGQPTWTLLPCLSFSIHKMGLVPRSFWVL